MDMTAGTHNGIGAGGSTAGFFRKAHEHGVVRKNAEVIHSKDGRSRFTGRERDAETGLDYFGARYMSAAQGRFTSPDPISGTPLHVT